MATGSLNNTTAAAFLKERFTRKRVENLVYPDNPLLGMVNKDTSFGGEDKKIPLMIADTKGTSATFSHAKANLAASTTSAFKITTVNDYSLFSIKGVTVMQSRGNDNAFFTALDRETKAAMSAAARRAAIGMYRSSTGTIGVVGSGGWTSTTFALSNRGDITNFEIGMSLMFSDTDGGAVIGATPAVITAIDRDAGEITTDANPHTSDAGDFITQEGDLNLRMSGLASWIPITAPTTGDSFFNVDRSTDVTRYSGHRIVNGTDATGIIDCLKLAMTRVGEGGGKPTHIFLPYNEWDSLATLLGEKKEFKQELGRSSTGKKIADVYFDGFQIYGPRGPALVVADQNCPAGSAYVLQLDTFTLESTGEVPMVLGLDNNNILREADDDAYEGRVGCYYQLSCCAPGFNAVVSGL